MYALISSFDISTGSLLFRFRIFNEDNTAVTSGITPSIPVAISDVMIGGTPVFDPTALRAAALAYLQTIQATCSRLYVTSDPAFTNVAPATHITDGSAGAVSNLPTNYNLLSGLLGIADGLNNANAAQNDLATKYNSLVTKFNSVLDALETHGIVST